MKATINFYKKMARDVSEILNAEGFEKDYTIRNDVDEKRLIIDFNAPLFGDAKAMFEECIRHAVTFFAWDLDLRNKPNYLFISPLCVTIQKAFTDSDFKD